MNLLRRWRNWREYRRLRKEAERSSQDIEIQRGSWAAEWKRGQK